MYDTKEHFDAIMDEIKDQLPVIHHNLSNNPISYKVFSILVNSGARYEGYGISINNIEKGRYSATIEFPDGSYEFARTIIEYKL